jgi:peptidoglycan/LPS O-acetylase OafA/YrhL
MHIMKSRKKFTFVLIALAFGACTAVEAMALGGRAPSPEIDPGLAVSAIALLGGTLAVLRVRRKKQ